MYTHVLFSLSHSHRNPQIWVTESLKFRNTKCWLSDDIVFCSACAVKSGKTSRESGDKITLDAFIKVEEVFVAYHINTNMYIYVITIYKKKISSCSLCIPISDYLIGSCKTYAYPSLLGHLKLTKPIAALEWCQTSFEYAWLCQIMIHIGLLQIGKGAAGITLSRRARGYSNLFTLALVSLYC